MKKVLLCLATLAKVLTINSALLGTAFAQDFTLDWFAIAAGGGESSGGDFALSATIGQPEAGGDLLGGDFAVMGGFWSIVTTLETPGAPVLGLSLTANQAVITWPENGSENFALEETSALSNGSGNTTWTQVNVTPDASNGVKTVRLPIAAGNRFYRLRKP